MPAIDAIIISAICVAFIGFGLVLAWADYQSRHISQRVEKSGLPGDHGFPGHLKPATKVRPRAVTEQERQHPVTVPFSDPPMHHWHG
jgi:hypothetical protein